MNIFPSHWNTASVHTNIPRICGNKCQLDATDVFIADLIACSTCFRHHYAHHQELESIIQLDAACGIWYFSFQVVDMVWTQPSTPHHTDNLRNKAPNTTGSNQLYNTLELLMIDIMVRETCWASNKICNKKHLFHLVGIYFHILTTMQVEITSNTENSFYVLHPAIW
jgi:hypothetical protein